MCALTERNHGGWNELRYSLRDILTYFERGLAFCAVAAGVAGNNGGDLCKRILDDSGAIGIVGNWGWIVNWIGIYGWDRCWVGQVQWIGIVEDSVVDDRLRLSAIISDCTAFIVCGMISPHVLMLARYSMKRTRMLEILLVPDIAAPEHMNSPARPMLAQEASKRPW